MKSMIQTEWVKPWDRTIFVCQLITQEEMAVSISITNGELVKYEMSSLMKRKRDQAKLSFMDLISQEFDANFPELVNPPSMAIKK